MSWKITLIGTGNVASFWAKTFHGNENYLLSAIGSNPEKTLIFKTENKLPLDVDFPHTDADIVLVCVQDRFIDSVLQTLPDDLPIFISAGLFSIEPYPQKNLGVIYPLQSLDKRALPSPGEVPLLLEVTSKNDLLAIQLVERNGFSYQKTDEKTRFHAHLSAVFINNFGYFIMKQGLDLFKNPSLSTAIFNPLIQKTLANIIIEKDLQTGPAKRNDQVTIERHLTMLDDDRKKIYSFLSDAIVKQYKDEL
jgi:hypothetical protein